MRYLGGLFKIVRKRTLLRGWCINLCGGSNPLVRTKRIKSFAMRRTFFLRQAKLTLVSEHKTKSTS